MKKILFLCGILGVLGAVEVNVNLGSVNIGTDDVVICDRACQDEYYRRSPPPPKHDKRYKKWQKDYEKWQREYYKKHRKK